MLKDYDYTFEYHSGKVNVVADALKRRAMTDLRIRDKQLGDESLSLWFRQIESGSTSDFGMNKDGSGLKHRLIDFVARCLTCQQVKAENQLPSGSWEDFLPLAEFAYNNNFQSSIQMEPYEALYGRKSRAPLCWTELGEHRVLGLELVSETEDKKKVLRFSRKGKLSLRFIESYQILKRVGPVTYQLELRLELDCIHDMFHVLMLRWYRLDPSYVISIKEIDVRSNLTFEEELVQILDCDVKVLMRKSILLMKVLWQNHGTEEAT
ncbi:uncharacterized protein [Gossypium hirsutum]|uniref:Tf2-1-like SH3-like domain-containing protein n=1 Tax=Gossypium hirsutum TaxID=3635 RepID=A0A1U8PME0_GOSHI|nr:uncharacterized protein LOC107960531 [Gossypium hirsutum]